MASHVSSAAGDCDPDGIEINIITLIRAGHRYVFLIDKYPGSLVTLYYRLSELASDPETNFTWPDALAVMTQARWLADLSP